MMEEVKFKFSSDSQSILSFCKNFSSMLVIALLCTFLAWYLQYHWKRRKLYRMAARTNGPLALPFLGNALYFSGSTSDILKNSMKICEYPSPVTIWLGHRLFFIVYEPKDTEIILTTALQKDELYKYAQLSVGTGIFSASVPKWRRHRRIIMPTFNQKILDSFVEIFVEKSEVLTEQLKVELGKGVFDIFEYLGRCTVDIICETAMGVTVNAQTTDCEYSKWTTKAMEAMYSRMFNIWYHFDFIYNRTLLSVEEKYATDKMHEFTGAVVREKRKAYQHKLQEMKEHPECFYIEEPVKRNSFLQELIELCENGAGFTNEEIREEVDTFMIAGSDTTAATNSFAFVMLGMFPEVQTKVYQEVIDLIGHERAIDYQDLGKLPYLERVLKETMRLFPIGPLIVRSITEDTQLDEYQIPAGASVVLVLIALHRNPKTWPNPLRFDPDRFLPEEVAKRHVYSWVPFSGGPRNCIGPKYAMMAMKSLVATVIRKYKISTDYKSIEDIDLKAELTLKPSNGYRVSLELRE